MMRAVPGIVSGTCRTRSEKHATGPKGLEKAWRQILILLPHWVLPSGPDCQRLNLDIQARVCLQERMPQTHCRPEMPPQTLAFASLPAAVAGSFPPSSQYPFT